MYISSFQLNNYKSYTSSTTLDLKPGFNIITGRNNAGKTTLLEALSLRLQNKPHRSLATVPVVGVQPIQKSWADVYITTSNQEVKAILAIPNTNFAIPVPRSGSVVNHRIMQDHGPQYLNFLVSWVLSMNEYTFHAQLIDQEWAFSSLPSFGVYEAESSGKSTLVTNVQVKQDGEFEYNLNCNFQDLADFGAAIIGTLAKRVYTFRAERFAFSTCTIGTETQLASDASNLGEVLLRLQTNPSRYQRYNDTVREVLPQIQYVTSQFVGDNKVEVFVWNEKINTEREDLAISLSECGTGVGQVLALLYVVLNTDHPRTILIDEPQSFLHPGAVRKLIDVLKKYPQHQYILTTHSPTVITASNPATITVIKQTGPVSDFQVINPSENAQLREYLTEIGARLSDVFGADDILWVEGPTEEICFPMIWEGVAGQALMGTAIIGVKHTGDFEGRHAKAVFEIYDKLSKGHGLLPPAVGFIFDKEGRSDKEREDIQRQSQNEVKFTSRRLYENYLLNDEAIATIMNSIEGFRDIPVTRSEVTDWINKRKTDPKYGPIPVGSEDDWIIYIHGARILQDLFSQLSEARVTYDKVIHSVGITEWIIKNSPGDLRELVDLLEDVITKEKNTSRA